MKAIELDPLVYTRVQSEAINELEKHRYSIKREIDETGKKWRSNAEKKPHQRKEDKRSKRIQRDS